MTAKPPKIYLVSPRTDAGTTLLADAVKASPRTYRELAIMSGVGHTMIHAAAKTGVGIRAEWAFAIARALGIPPGELFQLRDLTLTRSRA